jgi:hypothetical protein
MDIAQRSRAEQAGRTKTMLSKTPSRIARTIGTGLVVVSLAAGFVGGPGVAYGQPIGTASSNCSKPVTNTGDNLLPPEDRNIPEGTVQVIGAIKHICVGGRWVSCADITLTPAFKQMCASGLQSGGSLRIPSNLNVAGTLTSTGTSGSFSQLQPAGTTATFVR